MIAGHRPLRGSTPLVEKPEPEPPSRKLANADRQAKIPEVRPERRPHRPMLRLAAAMAAIPARAPHGREPAPESSRPLAIPAPQSGNRAPAAFLYTGAQWRHRQVPALVY